MNPKLIQAIRLPSLVLAAALQVLPIARAALPAAQTATNLLAIVFRWAAGAAAALGGVQAVSGASTVITNPLRTNLTQGVAWSMRLITAPKQANYWGATGLPPGIALTGTGSSSLWSIGGTPTASGTYNVGLTAKSSANANASETTTATLVIIVAGSSASPPTITGQPANQTVNQGQNATFNVTATGTAPLIYFWRKSTTLVRSGTSSSLTVSNAQPASAGSYSVIVSNSAGTATSSNVSLTVNVPATPPAITAQPANQTVTQGQVASFNVMATGTAPLTYFWRKGSAVLASGTSSAYSIASAQTSDAGNYSVIVSNSAGVMISSNATLTVNVPATPPGISAQPADRTVNQGQSATFTVTATGTAPLTFFWHQGATLVSSGSNASYTIANAQAANAGSYSVIVSNVAGVMTSSNATLAVNLFPVITSQPANQNVNQGQSASFGVTATGTGPLTYFWRKGSTVVASGSSASYTIPNAQISDAGSYSVIVSNMAGTITSSNATLSVNLPATPPDITVPPANQTVTVGQSATFNVTATGTAPLTYHWRKGTTVVSVSGNPFFTLAAAQAADAGSYSVIVSNAAGTATSSNATMTVNPAPVAPGITSQPTGQTVTQGQNATFNVTANGTAPLTYFWRKGSTILATGSSASYLIAGVQATDAGSYSVIVSNAAGSVVSSNATLTVNVPPTITSQPGNQTITQGQTAAFNVAATGTAPLTYFWRQGATVVASGSSASCTIPNAQPSDAGNYSVIVSNSAGSVTSSNATLTVNLPPPTALLTLHVTGNGSVSPDYQGQLLEIGRSYTLTANPDSGSVFAGWSGGVTSALPALTFVMQPGLVLEASFNVVTTPPPPGILAGNYEGLFQDPAGVSRLSAGFANLRVNNGGTFSGRLLLNGTRLPFAGTLDAAGAAATVINRRAPQTPLRLRLQLDAAEAQITGTVSNETWLAELIVRRAAYGPTNPAPPAGSYTFVIPGTPGATDRPAGHGFGVVQVSAAGQMRVRATLADGSGLFQLTTLSPSGQWPLFGSLYRGRGLVMGWLTFADRPEDDLNGVATWIRPQQPTSARYTFGFQVESEIIGSRYLPPAPGGPVLNPGHSAVILSDGGLHPGLTNHITIHTNNLVTSLDAPGLWLSLGTTTGQFAGRRPLPTGGLLRFSGVVLQKMNAGYGCFPAGNEDGAVYLGE